MQLEPGEVVDRYVIEQKVGQGGMAVVYRARHSQLGTLHAIKVLQVPALAIRDRLLLEGRAQATLRHPNIVNVTDVIDVHGAPGLVMELVEGPSLDDLLARVQLTIPQVDELAKGILAGVAEAHRHGLIHRDLKPANVMLKPTGTGFIPKVTDFGLAKVLSADEGPGRTQSNVAMGTPAYMAPEQVRDAKSVDQRADVFSLGALLYELLTGERAFGDGDVMTMFTRVTSGEFTPVLERVPGAPARMALAITSALRVDRDQRIPSCEALLAAWTGGPAPEPGAGAWPPALLEQLRSVGPSAPPTDPTWALPPSAGQTIAASTGLSLPAPAPAPGQTAPGRAPAGPAPRPARSPLAAALAGGVVTLCVAAAAFAWTRWSPDAVAPPVATAPPGAPLAVAPAVTPAIATTPPAPGAPWTSPTFGPMPWVEPGRFLAGSAAAEPDRQVDEVQHWVTLSTGYWLMEHEVTQGEWQAVMGTNPSELAACGPRCPVEHVSWVDVAAFVERASARDGRRYRLPTEAEWEYAARTPEPAVQVALEVSGWHARNAGETGHPVCTMPRDPRGLCDMAGNVWEWVGDWYGEYPPGAVTDPAGPSTGTDRVTKGGSWRYEPAFMRPAFRGAIPPADRYHNLGFRLALSP